MKYMKLEWPTGRRGPFPLDLWAWIEERINFEHKFVSSISFLALGTKLNRDYL
jgi:hypothetical protein